MSVLVRHKEYEIRLEVFRMKWAALDNFLQYDFDETHSLVLLAVSLNIQNTLQKLVLPAMLETLNTILKAATNLNLQRKAA